VQSNSVVLAALVTALSSPAAAQVPGANLARNLAATCTTCHGTTGVSEGGMVSLAGQSKSDLVRKLQDFKTGRKPATIMNQLAKGYTDAQIELIAGWFAAQRSSK